MWNEPMEEELGKVPQLYATENVPPKETVIRMHFFLAGCDWYAAEYDPKARIFFGFAILHGDLDNAEWGNFSLDELRTLRLNVFEVDRDLYWKPRRAEEVERIAIASGWRSKAKEVKR